MNGININYSKLSKVANNATRHAQSTYVTHGRDSEMFLNAKKRAERLIRVLKGIDRSRPIYHTNAPYKGSFLATTPDPANDLMRKMTRDILRKVNELHPGRPINEVLFFSDPELIAENKIGFTITVKQEDGSEVA